MFARKSLLTAFFVALSICSTLFNSSPVQAGGWEVSGAPPEPYIPDGDLTFVCEIEVTGKVGSKYQSYVSHHTFSTEEFAHGSAYFKTSVFDGWRASYISGESEQISPKKVPSFVAGQSIGIRFQNHSSGPVAVLTVFAEKIFGSYNASSSGFGVAPLSSGVIQTSVGLSISKVGKPNSQLSDSISVGAICKNPTRAK